MKQLRLFVLFLLLPVYAQPEEIYHIRRLSERELTRTYTSLLLDACRHADKVWQDSSTDPRAGYWGTGRSDQMNEGIRAISGMVLTCGALLEILRRPERFRTPSLPAPGDPGHPLRGRLPPAPARRNARTASPGAAVGSRPCGPAP